MHEVIVVKPRPVQYALLAIVGVFLGVAGIAVVVTSASGSHPDAWSSLIVAVPLVLVGAACVAGARRIAAARWSVGEQSIAVRPVIGRAREVRLDQLASLTVRSHQSGFIARDARRKPLFSVDRRSENYDELLAYLTALRPELLGHPLPASIRSNRESQSS